MKRSLPLCALLLSSFILSGCNEGQIASFAKQNDIVLTPDQVQSIANANQQNGNAYGKNKGNDIPVVRIGNGNNGISVPVDVAASALKGADGAQGAQGEKGDTGAQGEKGDKGDKGDQGEKGEKGDKGDKGDDGKDGRGIESLEINDEGHLIAHYTDGESQDVGSIRDNTTSESHDYERVGYTLKISPDLHSTGHFSHSAYNMDGTEGALLESNDWEITDIHVELIDVDNNNPSHKYKYSYSFNYTISNAYLQDGMNFCAPSIYIILDNSKNLKEYIHVHEENGSYGASGTVSGEAHSSIPFVQVTSCGSGGSD